MSATNRGATRHENDYYATPAWCVRALLATVQLPGGRWLEPAAGDGAIIKAVAELRPDVTFDAMDIDPEHAATLNDIEAVKRFQIADYPMRANEFQPSKHWPVIITNPPYGQVEAFVRQSLGHGQIVVMLLRLNWLASQKRNRFLREHPPSVYVLPRRPSFTGGGTDATDYAWFIWGMDATPTVRVIDVEVCK